MTGLWPGADQVNRATTGSPRRAGSSQRRGGVGTRWGPPTPCRARQTPQNGFARQGAVPRLVAPAPYRCPAGNATSRMAQRTLPGDRPGARNPARRHPHERGTGDYCRESGPAVPAAGARVGLLSPAWRRFTPAPRHLTPAPRHLTPAPLRPGAAPRPLPAGSVPAPASSSQLLGQRLGRRARRSSFGRVEGAEQSEGRGAGGGRAYRRSRHEPASAELPPKWGLWRPLSVRPSYGRRPARGRPVDARLGRFLVPSWVGLLLSSHLTPSACLQRSVRAL